MGYHLAGFEVVGVDLHPQPNYPFEFHQADAMTYPLEGFDVIHASPPCQGYSYLQNLGKQDHLERSHLIAPMRGALVANGVPYIIENVIGASLINPIRLCGSSFGLGVQRHRLFECSPLYELAPPCQHRRSTSIGVYGDHPQVSKGMNRARSLAEASEAMGIDWMTWHELCEAIPPAYTEWLGRLMLSSIARQKGQVA